MGGVDVVDGGFVADHVGLPSRRNVSRLHDWMRSGRPSDLRTRSRPCRARREAWLPRNSSMPPSGEVCCQSSTQAASAPTCFFAGEGEFHVLQASFAESEEEDAVVGGNIDEAVAGEILEHALADAVVWGRDAEGEGVAGAFGASGLCGRPRRSPGAVR